MNRLRKALTDVELAALALEPPRTVVRGLGCLTDRASLGHARETLGPVLWSYGSSIFVRARTFRQEEVQTSHRIQIRAIASTPGLRHASHIRTSAEHLLDLEECGSNAAKYNLAATQSF